MWLKSKTYKFIYNTNQFRLIRRVQTESGYRICGISQQNEDVVLEAFKEESEAEAFLANLWKKLDKLEDL